MGEHFAWIRGGGKITGLKGSTVAVIESSPATCDSCNCNFFHTEVSSLRELMRCRSEQRQKFIARFDLKNTPKLTC